MPELSRRLKWQGWRDDHFETIGSVIVYVSFAAFVVGLILLVVFGTSLRWALWLAIPVVIGCAIAAAGDEPRSPGGSPHA